MQLRFAELLYDNGMINRENMRGAKERDIYILRGDGEEHYHPRFTYHGFRYVEVTGYPGTPSLDSLRGHVVHTAVQTTGSFVASKQILNDIHRIIHWSDLTNLHSIPTDCDQRDERQGWMGDAQVSSEGMLLNFDMAAFYTNFLRDMRDVQGADGTITDTVPFLTHGQPPRRSRLGHGVPADHLVPVSAERRPAHAGRQLRRAEEIRGRSCSRRATNNVLRFSYYGDWVSTEDTPGAEVSDFYYYYDTLVVSKMAAALGNSADAASYADRAAQIKDAFNKEFFNPNTKEYANGTQTANVLPLFIDMVPTDSRWQVGNNLFNNIVYQHDTHLTTGLAGLRYLFSAADADQPRRCGLRSGDADHLSQLWLHAGQRRHHGVGTVAEESGPVDEFPESPHDGKRRCVVLRGPGRNQRGPGESGLPPHPL